MNKPADPLWGLATTAREYAVVIAFFALAIALSLGSGQFLTQANLINTLESGAIYGIVAVAITVLLIVGEFDLSAGAIFVLAGIVAARLQPELGTWPALALGIGADAAVGAFNGFVVAFLRVSSFVATLATSLMVVGIGTRITGGFQLYIADPTFGALGNARVFGLPWFVWIFFGFALLSSLVLWRTKLGRWIYATGGNAEAARLSGVRTRALKVGAFIFSGFTAGVAGAILVSRTATAIAGSGLADILFPAVAAAVVGGTSIRGGRGAVWRTVFGVYFLECIRNGSNLIELDPYYQSIVQGGIILLAVAADALSRRT